MGGRGGGVVSKRVDQHFLYKVLHKDLSVETDRSDELLLSVLTGDVERYEGAFVGQGGCKQLSTMG
jgi:hypothetical protein